MRNSILGALAVATLLTAIPTGASACGGFFCNGQIDQSGENILFVYNDDGTVTTVVQIFYQGPSDEFAWILPIPAEPTVAVGTDALFRQLVNSTTPRFTTRQVVNGTCRTEPSCYGYDDFSDGDERFGATGAAADAGAAAPPGEVEVTFRGNVGPFDVAVLTAGDADVLRNWLDDNGYEIPESAGAELDHYVDLDHYFVALRLQKNRSAGEIQPIVLTSDNNEPCIPIRLTRIATVPDMPITAFFLGSERSRPLNFMLVQPDLDDSGLWLGGTTYSDAVSRAVDDVGGHAFVTDYAGDAPEISLALESIEDLRTETDPGRFLQALQSRGFNGDSQLLGILQRHLPPPPEYEAQTFYNCLVNGWCSADVAAYIESIGFDPSALIDSLTEAIVDPREAAEEMVASQPHLTRLFTTMSADEMTVDPTFMRSSELPLEYSNIHEAVRTVECGPEYFRWSAPRSLTLPTGRTIVESEGVPYRGGDREYCEDRYEGDFRPGMDEERLREISRARGLAPAGGGAICSATPGAAGGLGALGLFGLFLVGFAWRNLG